jgi:hypothetical protein
MKVDMLEPSDGSDEAARIRRGGAVAALDRHRKLIAAWCEDLASPEFLRTGRTPRADAVCGFVRIHRGRPAI